MATDGAHTIPPHPQRGQGKSNTPSSEATNPLPASMFSEIIAWECSACACTNKDIMRCNCVICQTKRSVCYAIGGGPIDPVCGRMWINRLALPMEKPAIAAEVPTVMVKTHQMATEGAVSIATPPPPRQEGKPNTPSTDRTMPLPAQLQREVKKCHEKSHGIIASNILCVCLHHHIAKIKQMSTNVVEGYGKFYEQRYGKPLPQDVINKIQLLYPHCIEHWCAKLQLTVEEEEEWDPDNTLINKLNLLDLGEEPEERNSLTFTMTAATMTMKRRGLLNIKLHY
jgi:hypothetical protein